MSFPTTTLAPRGRFVMGSFDALAQTLANAAVGFTSEVAATVGDNFSAPSGGALAFAGASGLSLPFSALASAEGYTIFAVTKATDYTSLVRFQDEPVTSATFIVHGWDNASANPEGLLIQNSTYPAAISFNLPAGAWNISTSWLPNATAGHNRGVYRNGLLVANDAPGAFTGDVPGYLGCYEIDTGSYTEFFTGQMKEVVIFEGLLSAADRQAVESYLASTYSIVLEGSSGLPPVLSSPSLFQVGSKPVSIPGAVAAGETSI